MFPLLVSHVSKWRCVELLVTTPTLNNTLLLTSGVVSGYVPPACVVCGYAPPIMLAVAVN